MKERSSWAEFVATGAGSGYLPIFPGTWGALVVAVLVGAVHYAAPRWEVPLIWSGFLASSLLGVIAAGRVADFEHNPDPSKVVIDEFAGQFLTYLWLPVSMLSLVAGFLLFRLFDVIKPFPARQAESLPGGFGIMVDDLVAGVYSGLVLLLVHYLFGLR